TWLLENVVAEPIRLQGQYFDPETGLAYNYHRYFDPSAGIFISQDLLGVFAGHDLYVYAPNVWSWTDPFGLSCSKDAQKLRRNMLRKGAKEPPYPNSAHHIVMSNSRHPDMKAIRKHLKSLGIDINDASNGVFLPTNKKVKTRAGTKAHPHSKVHTDKYKAEV